VDAGWAGVVVAWHVLRFEGTAKVKASSDQVAMRQLGLLMPEQVDNLLVWVDGQPKPGSAADS